jgi:hypothetical protein
MYNSKPPATTLYGNTEEQIAQLLVPGSAIVGCLIYAINQTRGTAVREHIKADRLERVNLFITNLRRTIVAIDNLNKHTRDFFVTALCQKEIWYDVAVVGSYPRNTYVPHNNSITSALRITSLLLDSWCQQALSQSMLEAPEIDIQVELDALRVQVGAIQSLIKTAEKINADAEPVVDGLVALAEELL